MEGHRKFLGGGGHLKANNLVAKYEVKLEFPERKFPFLGRSMDIFWNSTPTSDQHQISPYNKLSLLHQTDRS